MRQILIPTDFSENAWNATRYALELFKEDECVFHLLNTYTPALVSNRFIAHPKNGRPIAAGSKEQSEEGLGKLMHRIRNYTSNDNHYFETYSSFAMLNDEVKQFVEQEGIDYIVMGTKGASDQPEVYMGHNTVRLLKSIKSCPILAIPKPFEFARPDEITFSTDFYRFYTDSELAPLIEMAKTFDATIRIVHIQQGIAPLTDVQQFNLGMLRKYLGPVEHYVHTVSELDSVSKTLQVFNEELNIHLLAMLNYRYSYLDQVTEDPVVKKKTFETEVPLMIIPELSMGGPGHRAKSPMSYAEGIN
ncbi:universal stress protein [Pseudozobellia thermophila]|uniref:Nucleotide-binding universal stress protein, UspA family n=1 Tax=Pseudozobellia thermophila TaxID=192903 RepID=A0A1M6L7Q8_9FLAO|nr:universal stress protein [Pseudozobellia thermophila]SHJ67079.1 Nucleotide-binding universal stress protein, UspA family [Pseudozobellia thermophila]